MNKSTTLILVAVLTCTTIYGQSLPSVLASSGDHFLTSTGALSWTLGEMVTETFHEDGKYLTQGFHQPASIRITGLDDGFELTPVFYPNPVRDFLNIEINEPGNYHIELLDMKGQKLVDMETLSKSGPIYQIDVQEFANALYLIRVTKKSVQKSVIVRIEKY